MTRHDRLTAEEIAALLGAAPDSPPDDPAPACSTPPVESALRSVSRDGSPVDATVNSDGASGASGASVDGPAERRDVLRFVRGLHDRLGRQTAAAASQLLRTKVELRLLEVERLEYRQLVLDLDSPTCLAVLRAEPLDVPLLLDLPPELLFPMLDCLLGGRPGLEPPPLRPLTEIEQRLAARIVRLWSHELRSVWRDVAPLEPQFDGWEWQPHRASLAPLREPLLVTRFRVAVGAVDAVVSLAIPVRALDELPAASRNSSHAHADLAARSTETARPAADEPVAVVVSLRDTRIDAADLAQLQVGDVLATDHPLDAPLIVTIDDRQRLSGRPGVAEGRRAVRIEAT